MSFLAPLFLLGLVGLSVPVIIHLTHKRRSQVQQFPSLMFLEQVPFKSARRQTIENWPLLLLRCLALAIIVAAFARPLFQGGAIAGTLTGGPEEVVVLVDRSYSMGYGDRWDRAQAAARDQLQALGPEDLGTLVFFGSGAQVTNRSTADVPRMLNALDSVQVSSQTTRYGPALKIAESVFEDTRLPNRRVVLISDFQRNGWSGDEGVNLPLGTEIVPIPILDDDVSNSAISEPSFQRELFSNRERVIASARVTHTGPESRGDVEVTLEVDGRALQTRTIGLESGDAESVTFDPFTLTDPNTRGRIYLSTDDLPQDDVANFVLSPNQGISVLLLDGGSSNQESLFLRRALEIGTNPAFLLEAKSVSQFRGAPDLQGRALVILNNVSLPAGAAGTAIEDYVREGGGLFIVLGPRSNWPDGASELVPGNVGAPRDVSGNRGGALGYVDYNHPAFEIFRGERSGDLSSASVFRYRPLAMSGSEGVIARYDNGDVAIAERRLGDGRVVILTSSLDNFWNDLVLQPVFLPFVHQTGKYLADFGESSESYLAGQVLDLWSRQGPYGPRGPDDASVDLVAITPTGGSIPISTEESSRFLPLNEQGLYEIRPPGGSGDNQFAVAVNVDLNESDLSTADVDELTAALAPGSGGGGTSTVGSTEVRPEDLERRQAFWRYLLIGAFLLLAFETFLSNRLSRATA